MWWFVENQQTLNNAIKIDSIKVKYKNKVKVFDTKVNDTIIVNNLFDNYVHGAEYQIELYTSRRKNKILHYYFRFIPNNNIFRINSTTKTIFLFIRKVRYKITYVRGSQSMGLYEF